MVSIGKALIDHQDGSEDDVLVIGIDHQGLRGWLDNERVQQCCQGVVHDVSRRETLRKHIVVFMAVTSRGWCLSETSWSGPAYLGTVRLILVVVTPTLISPVLKIGVR